MLRVYCDSNIFRYIKPSHPSHNAKLKKTMDDCKDKLVFCFSDAHIDDLKDSLKEYHAEDLEVIGEYVGQNYFTWQQEKPKQFKCLLATPAEVYGTYDFVAYKNAIENPFDLEKLFEDLGEYPEIQAAKKLLNSFLDLPVTAIAPAIDISLMDDRSKEQFDRMMPGYSNNSSIGEVMKGMANFGSNLLINQNELTGLRKYLREYLDKDMYSYDKWGKDFNQQFSENGAKKTFLETVDNMLSDWQKEDHQLKFSYAYSMLEVFNITEERAGGKLKKFNYGSLHTDGQHALFASFCDYLVTDDKGLQKKAHILYELFGIQTRIMSSEEFSNHAAILAGQEETNLDFHFAIGHELAKGEVVYEEANVESSTWFEVIKTTRAYFNYFNRMQYFYKSGKCILTFYCERPGQQRYYMFKEVELLIHKMLTTFGMDDEAKGEWNLIENAHNTDKNELRKWTTNGAVYIFNIATHSNAVHFLTLNLIITSQSFSGAATTRTTQNTDP